jgi:hypothetical protein
MMRGQATVLAVVLKRMEWRAKAKVVRKCAIEARRSRTKGKREAVGSKISVPHCSPVFDFQKNKCPRGQFFRMHLFSIILYGLDASLEWQVARQKQSKQVGDGGIQKRHCRLFMEVSETN